MAFNRTLAGAGFRIPQPDGAISAAGSKKPAVGREGHRSDLATKKSLKKSVFTLLALLVQRLLPVPLDRSHGQLTVDGHEGSHPWPSIVRLQEPEAKSHSRMVLSALPHARSRPSAEKATDVMRWLQNRFFIQNRAHLLALPVQILH